jgi:AraC-like DNA-binding protein
MTVSSRLDRRDDWERLAAQCNYRVDAIARHCKISRRQLHRYFWDHFGKAPKQWLDELRAGVAAREIARGDLMKTVSIDLKFKDPANFTRFFKRLQGTTPHNFDRKNGHAQNG